MVVSSLSVRWVKASTEHLLDARFPIACDDDHRLSLDRHCDRVTTAEAQRREAAADVATLHLVEQRR